MHKETDTLIAQLVDGLQPVRPLRFSHGLALALASLVAGVALVIAGPGLRADLAAGRPDGLLLVSAGLFLLLGLACSAGVVAMGSPRVGIARSGWGWAAAMAGLMPASALVVALVDGVGHALAESEPGVGVMCLAISLAVGLLTAGALVAWLRRGAPASPERAGLLTGIAAGSAGVFALSFACASNSLMHIGLWHGLAVAVGAVLGRLIVPPLVRW